MAFANTTPKWSTFTVLVMVLSIMGFFSAPTGVFAKRVYHTHKSVDTIKKHSAPKPPRNYAGNTAMEEVDDIVEIDYSSNIDQIDEEEIANNRLRKVVAPEDTKRFNIALGFTGKITPAQRRGFLNARARWQSIITKDLSTRVCVQAGTTMCGYKFTTRTCIDDIFIGVRVKPIDGVGKIAGSAGPCSVDRGGKVRMGVMTFDSADADQLIADGIWEGTILHEMGHVLGLGTLWQYLYLAPPPSSQPPFFYRGDLGNKAHVESNGGKGPIVIEDLGGYGTARAHWKESVYDSELMTGYLERKGTPMQISAMTIAALADLGYVVDMSKADPYTVPNDLNNNSPVKVSPTISTTSAPTITTTTSSDPASSRGQYRTLQEYEVVMKERTKPKKDESPAVPAAAATVETSRRLNLEENDMEDQITRVSAGGDAEKISLGNDIANVTIIPVEQVEGIEISAKPGREADVEKETNDFQAKQQLQK